MHRYQSADQFADDLQRFLDGRRVHARPRRYNKLLRERVESHMDAVEEWESERLISRRESDRLIEHLSNLISQDDSEGADSRGMRTGTVLLQLGGCLVFISVILWVAFYWDRLSATERIVAVGSPTVLINVAAHALWKRASTATILVFLVVGALLVPHFLLVLLFESGTLATRSATERELLAAEHFTNRQLFLAFACSTAYCAVLLRSRRFVIVSCILAAMLILFYVSGMLLVGFKHWIAQRHFAQAAASCLPLLLVLYGLSRFLDRPTYQRLAAPFYAVSMIGLLILLGVIAYDAPASWLQLAPPETAGQVNELYVTRELSFVLMGIVCFLIAAAHDRSPSRLARLWGGVLFRVVPPLCLVPLDALGNEPILALGTLGHADVYALELMVPVCCIAIMGLGARLQLRFFVYYGLLHLSVFIVRATARHLQEFLMWPVCVAGAGAVAVACGLWFEVRRRRASSISG